jgi:hypothetical protein
MVTKPIEHWVSEFESGRLAQDDGIRASDSKACKRAEARLDRAYRELAKHGLAGYEALLPLLEPTRSPSVRALAASFLLTTYPDAAIPVLEEFAEGDGRFAWSSRNALAKFKAGTWTLSLQ